MRSGLDEEAWTRVRQWAWRRGDKMARMKSEVATSEPVGWVGGGRKRKKFPPPPLVREGGRLGLQGKSQGPQIQIQNYHLFRLPQF